MTINAINSYASYNMMGMQNTHRAKESMLQKFDSNQDGTLDKTELTSLLEDLSSKTGTTLDVEDIFSALDANGDDTIDEKELQGLRKYMPPPPPPPQGGMGEDPGIRLMEQFDSDEDGSLNKVELTSLLNDFSEKTGNALDVEDIFSTLDTNGDNKIDKEELKGLRDLLPPPPDRADSGRGPNITVGAQENDDTTTATQINGVNDTTSMSNYIMKILLEQLGSFSTGGSTSIFNQLG